jgi:hypothetical protein
VIRVAVYLRSGPGLVFDCDEIRTNTDPATGRLSRLEWRGGEGGTPVYLSYDDVVAVVVDHSVDAPRLASGVPFGNR